MLEMHKGLLTLLKEFDCICKKHGITYYLEGGSLLGAVRHKGFLPWDDDVDLCITRDQFQKLLTVIDQELPENRELYCYERFPGYLRDTVKYTNLDTTVLFRNHILDGNAAGQHIDLFILDPVPSDPAQQAEYKALATVYSELMTPVYVMCSDIADHMDKYAEYLQMMEEKGRAYTLKLLREKLFTWEDSDACDTYLLRWGNRHVFYKKELFGQPVDLEFEDCVFPAPQQYYRFLRAEFGDNWMMIPEISQQEDHSTFDKLHVPCKTFIADYSPFIDYQQYWEDNSKRKAANLKLLRARKAKQKDEAMQQRILYELELQPMTAALSEEQKLLAENGRYAELAAYFQPYYTAQLTDLLLQNGQAIRIDENVLYAAAAALVMTGQLKNAEKLLEVNSCHSQPFGELSQLIGDVRSCMLAAEEERYLDARQLARRWIGQFPLQLNLASFLIRQGLREEENAQALIERTQQLLRYYPQSDELMKLMGDLLTQQNDNEAETWYRRCAEITRNGIFLMELAEYLPQPEEEDEQHQEEWV